MHDIEPHYRWRDRYIAAEDERSPFYGRTYDEFRFTQKIYNYFIHPQWDYFGSNTLYMKILFVDYEEAYALIELIGEWNDCLTNDVMYLKRQVVDILFENGIRKFAIFCDNVLNFHGSDDSYYEEWYDDIKEDQGWICFLNTLEHVEEEMQETKLQYYVSFGRNFNDINWRPHNPKTAFKLVEALIDSNIKSLSY